MKNYYNNAIVDEIDYLIKTGNPVRALEGAEKYIEDYPLDAIGPIYKARAMVSYGKIDEGIALANEQIASIRFHEDSARIIGYTWYGWTLYGAGLYDKAIEAFEKAISYENIANNMFSYKARNGVVKTYLMQQEFEKVISFVDSDPKNNSGDYILLKKGYALINLNKYHDALVVLNKVRQRDSNIAQQLNYYKGKCYFNLKNYDEALIFLSRSMVEKNIKYYGACMMIARIKYLQGEMQEATRYAEVASNAKEFEVDAILLLFKINMKNGYTAKAKSYIDKIEDEYIYSYHISYYYYVIGEFEKAIEYTSKDLNKCEKMYFEKLLHTYIGSYIRLGKYEDALYILEHVENDINPKLVEIFKTYLNKKLGKEDELNSNLYSCKQIVNYDRDVAIDHILDHHIFSSNYSSFKDKEYAIKLYDYVKSILGNYTPIYESIFDKYLIPYNAVGFDKDGNCNTLVVIVNPDDSNIITMYPLSGNDIYLEETEEHKNKAKSRQRSQTEKFQARFAKFQKLSGN